MEYKSDPNKRSNTDDRGHHCEDGDCTVVAVKWDVRVSIATRRIAGAVSSEELVYRAFVEGTDRVGSTTGSS